ncbi:MAG: hypothetical protein L3J29_12065 [Cyclobacteriaceae bacterium]|nr:hypothetical protein [Cyclobacteriaceae bacterium]
MKKLSIYITLVFIITSCELTNVLDNDPPNNLVPTNVVLNENDAKALLNGVYSTIISRVSDAYYIGSEFIPGLLIGSMSRISSNDFLDNDVQPTDGMVQRYWLIFYKTIDLANNVIFLTSELPDSEFSGNSKA